MHTSILYICFAAPKLLWLKTSCQFTRDHSDQCHLLLLVLSLFITSQLRSVLNNQLTDSILMAAQASSPPQLAEHFTFRVGHVDDVETIAANNIAMAKVCCWACCWTDCSTRVG